MLLWLALFAFQNFQRARAAAIQDAPLAPSGAPQEDAVERADVAAAMEDARNALVRRDFDAALAAAARLEGAGGPYRQAAGLRLRAGVELARGDNESAAMFAGQSFSIWQSPDAAVVAARAARDRHPIASRMVGEHRPRQPARRVGGPGAQLAAAGAGSGGGAGGGPGRS